MVLNHFRPDVIGVVETWLHGDEVISVPGYTWLGNNRSKLNKKAVRGLGGVGVLISMKTLEDWVVQVLYREMEDTLWVKLVHLRSQECLTVAVCYIPPLSSSRDVCAKEAFEAIGEQVQKYTTFGTPILMGDFNARCGGLSEAECLPPRVLVDDVVNDQGRMMVDFLKASA